MKVAIYILLLGVVLPLNAEDSASAPSTGDGIKTPQHHRGGHHRHHGGYSSLPSFHQAVNDAARFNLTMQMAMKNPLNDSARRDARQAAAELKSSISAVNKDVEKGLVDPTDIPAVRGALAKLVDPNNLEKISKDRQTSSSDEEKSISPVGAGSDRHSSVEINWKSSGGAEEKGGSPDAPSVLMVGNAGTRELAGSSAAPPGSVPTINGAGGTLTVTSWPMAQNGNSLPIGQSLSTKIERAIDSIPPEAEKNSVPGEAAVAKKDEDDTSVAGAAPTIHLDSASDGSDIDGAGLDIATDEVTEGVRLDDDPAIAGRKKSLLSGRKLRAGQLATRSVSGGAATAASHEGFAQRWIWPLSLAANLTLLMFRLFSQLRKRESDAEPIEEEPVTTVRTWIR